MHSLRSLFRCEGAPSSRPHTSPAAAGLESFLENFIASTSIFCRTNSKLQRANGGCLGSENR
jgi:hypothetical protein